MLFQYLAQEKLAGILRRVNEMDEECITNSDDHDLDSSRDQHEDEELDLGKFHDVV